MSETSSKLELRMNRSSLSQMLCKLLLNFFCKIHRKTLVLEALFNKTVDLQEGTPVELFFCEF